LPTRPGVEFSWCRTIRIGRRIVIDDYRAMVWLV
jgi:hypothetical protein